MSAVAGCCWFDERPAHADDLRASTQSVRHRSRQPFRARCAGPVALAYAADLPDSCQPLHDASTGTTVIVDGRIDNLVELSGALGVSGRASGAVVLAAWRRWGLAAGSHLLGDFVVVVSDERTRRVVCLRAPLGQRSLFYGAGPRGVVFGSEVQQIVRHPAISTGVNDAMVAEYLTAQPATVADTLWRGVHRLPPSCALEITGGAVRVERYWDFDPEARVRYKGNGEYAEHFREIFTRAVECCLCDAETAGVFLSGGIDSSCVAGVAQSIGAAEGRAPLHAFTLAFPGRACDETAYSQTVVDKWGLAPTRADATPPSRDDLVRGSRQYLDVPNYPNGLMVDPLRVGAAAAGVRVLLTGFGGDDFFTGEASPFELLRAGQVLAWGRATVGPMLSDRARDILRPVFGARRARRPWIRAAFAARTALEDRLRPRAPLPFPTREQQEIYRGVSSLVQILGDEMEDRAAHAAGVEQRHPFYDRRVAEFGLALPGTQRSDASGIKVVIRRALGEYLPPAVAARTSSADKAEFSPAYVEAFEALDGRECFRRLRSEEAGWVDGRVIRQMYEEMIQLYSRGGDAYIRFIGPLWAVVSLELWLEAASTLGSNAAAPMWVSRGTAI